LSLKIIAVAYHLLITIKWISLSQLAVIFFDGNKMELKGGLWGSWGDVCLALLPIVYILIVTLKKHDQSSSISLPVAAFLSYLIRLVYFGSSALTVHAALTSGILGALTPLSIVSAAIFLFESMEKTDCLDWMTTELKKTFTRSPNW
jgi:hypothetical protein